MASIATLYNFVLTFGVIQVENNAEGSSLSLYKQLATLREKMFESDFGNTIFKTTLPFTT